MSDDTPDDSMTSDLGGAYTEMMNKATAAKAEESQQQQSEKFGQARGGAIKPPYPPKQLAKLIELNTTHAKCGFSKARNVAGFGLEIVPHPEVEDPDESQKEDAKEFWFEGDSTWQVGPMESELATPADVLEMAWADYEFIGWLSIETLTNMAGEPTGLAYIPAPTIRKRKDAPGFVQEVDGDLQYFGSFGDRYGDDRTFVDANSGNYGSGVDGDVANEIIWKRNHTPFVEHYGTPDIVPAIPNIEGDQEARAFNIEYFDNSAVPKLAIIVEGGTLSEESRKDIRKLFHDKLQEENHRTAILEVNELLEEKAGQFADPNSDSDQVRIRVEPLTVGMEEDASFLDYHSHNEHEILKAHEVPPIEAGTIESGAFSTDAEAQRKSYLETTIQPKQEALAELLYETIHDALGVTDYTVQFRAKGVDTRLTDAEVVRTRAQASQGTMLVDEVREELGLEPLGGAAGNMMLAELGGMGGPMGGGGVGQAIEDLVDDRVDEVRDDLLEDVRTESRIQTTPGDD
ncbi:phage portal protein [Natrinema pallidum]|uniref:Phage portal protein n=1 Tax=Natrinema pallidum TaxID=69527 RepID=A0A4P9TFG7_9EURY|nr:phage portal protein [Natrinema pallidum]QCW03561.1 phage portal protein [Natrinema pallidum]